MSLILDMTLCGGTLRVHTFEPPEPAIVRITNRMTGQSVDLRGDQWADLVDAIGSGDWERKE